VRTLLATNDPEVVEGVRHVVISSNCQAASHRLLRVTAKTINALSDGTPAHIFAIEKVRDDWYQTNSVTRFGGSPENENVSVYWEPGVKYLSTLMKVFALDQLSS
jgi:hypothetical protein